MINKFPNKLRDLRKSLGYAQGEMASRLDISVKEMNTGIFLLIPMVSIFDFTLISDDIHVSNIAFLYLLKSFLSISS